MSDSRGALRSTRWASDLVWTVDYVTDATFTFDMAKPDDQVLSAADIKTRTSIVLQVALPACWPWSKRWPAPGVPDWMAQRTARQMEYGWQPQP